MAKNKSVFEGVDYKKDMKIIKAKEEFKEGKHSIGVISSGFIESFGNHEFTARPMPIFQTLTQSMTDLEIETKLNPGLCELGDILTFLDNAPDECKKGYTNLFYTYSYVVNVYWRAGDREWHVFAWRRGDEWRAGHQVFSPATVLYDTQDLTFRPSDTLTLERAVEMCKEAGYVIYKQI